MVKGNNGSGNNEERDLWQTPKDLFNNLNKQYKFDFDCCALKHNAKCELWCSDFEKYDETHLSQMVCWMNPPFSKANEMIEHFMREVNKGIMIYRFDNAETKLWQKIYQKADWIFIFEGRINYEGMEGKGSRFPSALAGFGVEPPKNLRGKTLSIN